MSFTGYEFGYNLHYEFEMLISGDLLGHLAIRRNNSRCRLRMRIDFLSYPGDMSLYYVTIQETRKYHGATQLHPFGRLVTKGRLARRAHWIVSW